MEDKEPTNDVPDPIVGECALGLEGALETGPGDAENAVEEPGCGGGEGHAEIADVEGVSFGGVCEGDGAFSGRVDDAKEVLGED